MSRATGIRISILPLALAAIFVVTAVPLEFRPAVPWSMHFGLLDFLLNVVLYAPLGICRWRRSMITGVAQGALLSTGIEVLQIWDFGRFGSVSDVLANTLGVAGGMLAGRWLVQRHAVDPATLPLGRWSAIFAAVGSVLLIVAWKVPATPSTITNWDIGYDVLLGNETTGDRPWRGTIAALAVLPGSLSLDEINELSNLEEPAVRAALARRDAYLLPGPLDLEGGVARRLPVAVSRHFFGLAVKRNAFSVIARITPADVRQRGPARIVSYSAGTSARNFDLGQQGDQLVFRIRTLVTSANGMNPNLTTPPVLRAGHSMTVAATFDGALVRVFVDGRARGRLNLAAAGCGIADLCDTGLPFAAFLFGVLLAIIATCAPGGLWSRYKAGSLVIMFAAGGAVMVALFDVGYGTFLSGWGAPVLVLAGAGCLFLSLRMVGDRPGSA